MKGLSIAGTAAMFLVGGGILTHGLPVLNEAIGRAAAQAAVLPTFGSVFGALAPLLANAVTGLIAGAVTLALVRLFGHLRGRVAQA